MNVLIVEDEAPAAENIIMLLKKTGKPFVIQGVVQSNEHAVKFISSGLKPDLLIIDIELADRNSFEILKMAEIETPIIFTSDNDQYALQAFKYFSIDYLLKPIQEEDLVRALEKWSRITDYQASIVNHQGIQRNNSITNENQKPKQRLLIKSGNKLQYKPTEEVAYIYADGKEVYIYTKIENKKFLIDYTLERLESLLDKQKFFRISRKVIVNADVIAEVKGLISTRLEVKLNQPCDHDLTISRDRSAMFKAWLDQ